MSFQTLKVETRDKAGLITLHRPDALKTANQIAGLGRTSVLMAKEAINRAFETSLSEGLLVERRLFQSLFATEDQKEGMAAFVEKRPPLFGKN